MPVILFVVCVLTFLRIAFLPLKPSLCSPFCTYDNLDRNILVSLSSFSGTYDLGGMWPLKAFVM